LNMSKVCGFMVIDVNGLKGPNYYGRDIFQFYITNGKGPAIYPVGGPEGKDFGWSWSTGNGGMGYCNKFSTYGETCAGRIMDEGWQMKY